MIKEQGYKLNVKAREEVKNHLKELFQNRDKYFGNARAVRKIILEIIKNQNLRVSDIPMDVRKKSQNASVIPQDVDGVNKLAEQKNMRKKPSVSGAQIRKIVFGES